MNFFKKTITAFKMATMSRLKDIEKRPLKRKVPTLIRFGLRYIGIVSIVIFFVLLFLEGLVSFDMVVYSILILVIITPFGILDTWCVIHDKRWKTHEEIEQERALMKDDDKEGIRYADK